MHDATSTTFFIPDLCTPRMILMVVVAAELMAIAIVLVGSYYRPFSFERLALASLFVQWVALTLTALLCQLRDRLNRLHRAWAGVLVLGLVMLDSLIVSLLAVELVRWVAPELAVNWPRTVLINVLVSVIIGGLVMRHFYVQSQLRLKDRAALQSRVQALQSRIRPHFLFNSMNIIASLIPVDPQAAEQAVEDLSWLFRASLRDCSDEVTLAEELLLCRRYVRIEQLRMGKRLHVEWDIAVAPVKISVPLLTLQPLLENAVYHGVQPLAEGGVVRVKASLEAGNVHLSVLNPGSEGAAHHQGNRMALDNIRHRLEALHGSSVEVFCRADGQQYETHIIYPAGK